LLCLLIVLLSKVGKVFYNLEIKIDVLSDVQEGELTHVIFQLFFKNDQYERSQLKSNVSMASLRHNTRNLDANLPVRSEVFFELFPFHVVNGNYFNNN